MTSVAALERRYLQAALTWLDARLELEVRRWQIAGRDPADRFRGLYISDQDALALTHPQPASAASTHSSLTVDSLRALAEACDQALEALQQLEAESDALEVSLRLRNITSVFHLSPFEWKSFIICLAPALDLRYERIYSYLQDDVTRVFPSVDLLLSLLGPDEQLGRLDYLQHFERFAPLRGFRLILPIDENASLLRQAFRVAPGVVEWLLGAYSPAGSLGDWAELSAAPDSQEQVEQASSVFQLKDIPARRMIESVQPFLCFHGEDLLQQSLTARQLAVALDRPLLTIRLAAEENSATALEKLYPAVRDARLLGALLYIQGCDMFIDSDGCLVPACFEALRQVEDTVLLGSRVPFKFGANMPGNDYPLMVVPFARLSVAERADLWEMLIEDADSQVSSADLRVLAGQFALSSGQVVAAASSAMSAALQAGRALTSADLFTAARFHSGHHLADLAHKIEPRYDWDDLVLPETPRSMLREMVNMVKSRALVLEEWGLGRKLTAGSGVAALFSGPPGTGKTLAAQIMAHQLGIDLYRIDLSTVVSKYIGETEKNLERIFRDASQSNAILFFDEADAIFGKRSEVKDAHDRYANLEVGYLLQRMESYDGLAILATNLRANLDDAFTRRLQFIVTFPFPDEEYREKIWNVLIPPELPRAENLDLRWMAKRFKVTGGGIRNIIVSAAYVAAANGGQVTMDHLLHGAKREFQKMGKLLQESDFEWTPE